LLTDEQIEFILEKNRAALSSLAGIGKEFEDKFGMPKSKRMLELIIQRPAKYSVSEHVRMYPKLFANMI